MRRDKAVISTQGYALIPTVPPTDSKAPVVTALALSGGGFRATLFHLGLIEYLRDVELLGGIRAISSVSGGSVVAAHVALNWERYNGEPVEFLAAKKEILQFTQLDVRGRIVRRMPLMGWLPRWVRRLLASGAATDALPTWLLERYYDRWLFRGAAMRDLPPIPHLFILSTNLTEGCLTSFSQAQILHFPSNEGGDIQQIDAGLTRIASAVAASSAYPALFPPLSLDHDAVGAREDKFSRQFFTDAGVTDNLGVQPFQSHADRAPDETVLVSDAGQSFLVPRSSNFGILRTALRAFDLMMFRVRTLALSRLRNTQRQKVTIASISDSVEVVGAAPHDVQRHLETIRTDLDSFSNVEAEELLRHGYYCAQKAIGIRGKNPPSFKFGVNTATARARGLISGARRRPRLVNCRDWATWVLVGCLLTLGRVGWLVVPRVADGARIFFTQYRIMGRPLPEWLPIVPVTAIEVEKLEQPRNEGFEILRDDRVWDLRRLEKNRVSGEVTGPSRMTRTTTLIRRAQNITEFVYLFQTSGTDFRVECLTPTACQVQLRAQRSRNVNGQSLLKAYELRIDVSNTSLREPFILTVQAETTDGFLRDQAWSVAMQVTEHVDEASIRIVLPSAPRPHNPQTLSYLNNTAGQADTKEGTTFLNSEGTDLVWILQRPRIGWTYRIKWSW